MRESPVLNYIQLYHRRRTSNENSFKAMWSPQLQQQAFVGDLARLVVCRRELLLYSSLHEGAWL
jgi:hypothetical protein